MKRKITLMRIIRWRQLIWRAGLCGASAMAATALSAVAQERHQHGTQSAAAAATVAISTATPFSALMDQAMVVMADGMQRAPMTGNAEHDFIVMMIPHHQGAIDMAKSVLLYTQDPELKNLAQGIITDQQNEIRVMQAWLQRYQARQANPGRSIK